MKRWISFIVVLCLFCISGCSAEKSLQPTEESNLTPSISVDTEDKEYFPDETWRTSIPEEQGVDSEKLYEMIKNIKDYKFAVDNLIIVRNGYVITDATFQSNKKDTLHELQSATKSFTSALVGIAIKEEYIKSIDEKVVDYFPELKFQNLDSRKKAITLQNLLSMTAGLEWDGFYTGTYDDNSKLYFSTNPVQYILDKPMVKDPGKTFLYNNGASQLLLEIIQKSSDTDLDSLVEEKLFQPLGITNYYWESSSDGTLLGYYGLNMTAMDMAKFGYLYLNKGMWNEQQIIPESWIDESTKKQVDETMFRSSGYGYQWWINSFGGYSARGLHGQYIFVMPDLNMVVVFQSSFTKDDLLPLAFMENNIIPAAESSQALPANEKAYEMLKSICSE